MLANYIFAISKVSTFKYPTTKLKPKLLKKRGYSFPFHFCGRNGNVIIKFCDDSFTPCKMGCFYNHEIRPVFMVGCKWSKLELFLIVAKLDKIWSHSLARNVRFFNLLAAYYVVEK